MDRARTANCEAGGVDFIISLGTKGNLIDAKPWQLNPSLAPPADCGWPSACPLALRDAIFAYEAIDPAEEDAAQAL